MYVGPMMGIVCILQARKVEQAGTTRPWYLPVPQMEFLVAAAGMLTTGLAAAIEMESRETRAPSAHHAGGLWAIFF